ncbi:MAG: LysM peptidoglycan-binding domain-containing M23 family metallopeptidase [Candidatus Pacebacteria bacterium]|nr:LysM peptidoglycan-binding domain-containing M23 family metallopeptidase [Candidatus Paceibacterota bacterium]
MPTSGIQHKIKKGDTLKSIAKKYNVSIYDIQEFNLINTDKDLIVGKDIVIPNGQISPPTEKKQSPKSKKGVIVYKNGRTPIIKAYNNSISGYFIRPMTGGIKTQGIHGRNAIDIGAPVGTPVLASAGGVVLLARNTGYNGGYGTYIIISHPNGTQTLYGHLSRLNTQTGDNVSQGQIIGFSGNSGRSTGPHLHFEIIGAVNPF